MSGYIGVLPVPQTTQTRESFTATAGQTSFGTSGYQIDHLDVYLNGVKLAAADFTATNGSDIVLATGAALNDILEMVAFETFTIANQSFTGTTTVNTLVVTNTVDGRDVSVDGAKLDTIPIISTSSTPSFTAKGDGTTDGYIQLNCSQNSHGIKLKSPPHSANASYTLTFPNDDGNAGQFLKTNGSGVLSWATDSTTDSTKLPLAGGAMTGPITTNSTFDGVDVATRDAVLTSTTTTAGAALPKAGGVLTGAVTTNSTFDGRDVATDGTKLDTVETNADVTDTANVTAAGALMDSELTNLAAVKAINQSLVTTATPTFAGSNFSAGINFTANDGIAVNFKESAAITIDSDDNDSSRSFTVRSGASGSTETLIQASEDAGVTLYYDNAAKIATTATGIDVTGGVEYTSGTLNYGGTSVPTGNNHTGLFSPAGNIGLAGQYASINWPTTNGAPTTTAWWMLGRSAGADDQFSLRIRRGETSGSDQVAYIVRTTGADNAAVVDKHEWYTGASGGVKRMTVENDGDVTIENGNLVIGTAGKGIDFSAYGAGTNVANNLLDDYEEGIWTPTGVNFTVSAIQSAKYVKIGKQVTLIYYITGASGNSGAASIGGMPFASANLGYSVGSINLTAANPTPTNIQTRTTTSSSAFAILTADDANVAGTSVDSGHIIGTQTYFTS